MFKTNCGCSLAVGILILCVMSPWFFISEDPKALKILLTVTILLVAIIPPAIFLIVTLDGWRNLRHLRPAQDELKKHDPQEEATFLATFPEKQRPLAATLRNSLAWSLRILPKYVRHDSSISTFLIPDRTDPSQSTFNAWDLEEACEQCHYLSSESPYNYFTSIWYDQNLKRLGDAGASVEDFIKWFISLDQRLGDVLAEDI